MRPKLSVIVNPKAGFGRSGKIIGILKDYLVNSLPEMDVRIDFSKSYQHAKELGAQAAEQAKKAEPGQRPDALVVVGGDGMANLALNACANRPIQMGLIPAGTGNDFARATGVPLSARKAAKVIAAGVSRKIDLALVTDIAGTKGYIGCVVSTGYDAKVNHRVNNARIRLGSFSYASAVLTEIAKLKPLPYRLIIDGESLELEALVVAVANGGYVGGGIHISPQADPSDGMLDLTIIQGATRFDLIRLFPQIISEGFVKHPAVTSRRATQVILDGDGLIPMADGELIGDGSVPLKITSEPGVLDLLVPLEK